MKRNILWIIIAAMSIVVSMARSEMIFFEDFEDGVLDPMVTISTVGSFNSSPRIKTTSILEGNKAFGSGRSTKGFNAFYDYVTHFVITFPEPVEIKTLSFIEFERYDNWGASGSVLVDGKVLNNDVWAFGRLPYNDRHADTAYRSHEFPINATASQIDLRVHDITNLSEIFIDDIKIEYVPEPATLLLLGLGSFAIRMKR